MTEKSPTAGRRSRADQTRRTVLIIILLLVVVIGGSTAAGLAGAFEGGVRLNTAATPRNIDVWAAYPDDTLRFVTVFHPLPGAGSSVDVAGPLVQSEANVLSAEVVGEGELIETAYLPGPGQDSGFVYPQYTLSREPEDDSPYGVDVLAELSPYLSADPLTPAQRILSLGTAPHPYYAQVIVAVALPAGTEVVTIEGLQPYRETQVRGWDLYYFDTTTAAADDAISITYLSTAGREPPELDVERVDQRR